MPINTDYFSDLNNPLEWIADVADANQWPLERHSDTEMSFDCEGRFGTFTLSFMWQEEFQALQFCCASTLIVPDMYMNQLKKLLFTINHKLWLGNFDVNDSDRVILFRHTSLMRGLSHASSDFIEDMIDIALSEFDRFYPAFKMQVVTREIANDLLDTAISTPMGEA